MTTPNPARAVLASPRALAAWALVAYAALHLLFSFFDWLMPGDGNFLGRSASNGFTNLLVMAMPIVAVVLAALIAPAVSGAKLLTMIALLEYAVSQVLGALAWLIGLGSVFDGGIDSPNDAVDGLRYLIMGLADLGLILVAAYLTYRAFVQLGGRLPVTVTRSTPAPPPPSA
jgi:hypothetical protein